MKRLLLSATFLAGCLTADAQQRDVFVHSMATPGIPFEFMSAEFGVRGKVVTGAPYTANATTETTQVLADGNRIRHQSTSSIARDSQGRTRRDTTLPAMGTEGGDPPKISAIFDPVANVSYTLDHHQKIARKMPGRGVAVRIESRSSSQHVVEDVVVARPPIARQIRDMPAPANTESLGKRTIEGVLAEGTRTTRVIPAGQIGNERPIEIVSEQWYSPELQVVVLSKHSDPRAGETVYSLTSVVRSEPAPSVFEVPADYTVSEEPGPMMRRRQGPGGPPE